MSTEQKIDFIQSYERASNAATGSKYDPNANEIGRASCRERV